MTSVYIHIPFCNNICSYCDFCKVLYNKYWADKYLDALTNEINDIYNNEIVDTIYIGGGTPSALKNDDLEKFAKIIAIFNKSTSCEFTFECNIVDITEELLDTLTTLGVNRLSIGIESFDEAKLKEMQRLSLSYEETKIAINMCRSKGFNNINLDLIYGFQNETLAILQNDIKKIISLKPDHISTYSLMIGDNTALGIKDYKNISEDMDAKMYEMICKKLKSKGYHHYEVSNFALTGKESRHNLQYWNNKEYYGFGLGASGYILGMRYDNTKSLTKYLQGETRVTTNILSKKDIMENEIMLGLRKLDGINLKEFYDKYGVNMQDEFPIEKLFQDKELSSKNGNIFIPKDKIYIMNEILIKLL